MKSLKAYKEKRHFTKTPEPKGKVEPTKGKLLFTVQKHAASRLHYDFRIEADGVLKSWAVPKGPSLNPDDKRLAIMVEDHPFDYHDFEGIIPKGNYGAGAVIVWDEGTYTTPDAKTAKESEKKVLAGLEKGHIDLILEGEKLTGEFTLIRLKNSDNEWLLFKKKDSSASKIDVTKQDQSVITGHTIADLARNEEPSILLKEAPKASMPTKIHPMLSVLTEEPFDREGWIFEIKWDGYRAISFVKKGKTQLFSRNQLAFNDKFPSIADALKKSKEEAILDGEIVILDKEGKPQFQLIQNYQNSPGNLPIYYVFDLLYYKGKDLRSLPLIERKALLKEYISSLSHDQIRYSDHIETNGIGFFKKAAEKNLEGIMAKDSQSAYVMKRSPSWKKIKTHGRQEVVIVGFTKPRGSRKKFGALIMAVYDKEGDLVYAGHVGGGFTGALLDDLYQKMEPLIQTKSPFKKNPKVNMPVTWIKPKLVCEVAFAEWTKEGQMRQPIFKGLRIDKKPKDVVREDPHG